MAENNKVEYPSGLKRSVNWVVITCLFATLAASIISGANLGEIILRVCIAVFILKIIGGIFVRVWINLANPRQG